MEQFTLPTLRRLKAILEIVFLVLNNDVINNLQTQTSRNFRCYLVEVACLIYADYELIYRWKTKA